MADRTELGHGRDKAFYCRFLRLRGTRLGKVRFSVEFFEDDRPSILASPSGIGCGDRSIGHARHDGHCQSHRLSLS
jgi:hypothetical protein